MSHPCEAHHIDKKSQESNECSQATGLRRATRKMPESACTKTQAPDDEELGPTPATPESVKNAVEELLQDDNCTSASSSSSGSSSESSEPKKHICKKPAAKRKAAPKPKTGAMQPQPKKARMQLQPQPEEEEEQSLSGVEEASEATKPEPRNTCVRQDSRNNLSETWVSLAHVLFATV